MESIIGRVKTSVIVNWVLFIISGVLNNFGVDFGSLKLHLESDIRP